MKRLIIALCLCTTPAAAQTAPIPPEVAAVKKAIETQAAAARAALPPAQRNTTPITGSGKITITPPPSGQH